MRACSVVFHVEYMGVVHSANSHNLPPSRNVPSKYMSKEVTNLPSGSSIASQMLIRNVVSFRFVHVVSVRCAGFIYFRSMCFVSSCSAPLRSVPFHFVCFVVFVSFVTVFSYLFHLLYLAYNFEYLFCNTMRCLSDFIQYGYG